MPVEIGLLLRQETHSQLVAAQTGVCATSPGDVIDRAWRGCRDRDVKNGRVVMEDGSSVVVSGRFHAEESPARLFDGSNCTKWYSMPSQDAKLLNEDLGNTLHWLLYNPAQPLNFSCYTITSGNDCPARDPKVMTRLCAC